MDVYCVHCGEETPQTVVYGNKYLKQMSCQVCGTVLEVDRKKMLKLYAKEFVERILTKPYRMVREIEGEKLSEFMLSMPIRVVSKPARIAKEISDLVKKRDWPRETDAD